MNILYVAPDIPVPHTGDFVGGSTHVLKVAEGLVMRGNRIFIISRRVSKSQRKYEKIAKNIFTIRVYRGLFFPVRGKISGKEDREKGRFLHKHKLLEKTYFFLYRLILIPFMIYILKKYRIDVVLDRSSSKGIGVFSGFLIRIPTFVELLDIDYSNLSLRLTNKIFAYTKKIVNPRLYNKVQIVSAGVDMRIFKPLSGKEVKKKYSLEDKKVVVYEGSLSAWHGAEDLIEIAAKLDEKIRFLMVGKDLNILEEKAKEKEVYSKFIFAGFVKHEEVPEYISAADIAVAPYNPRGFKEMEKYGFYFSPIKIFEYMACGKAVVASNLDIIRDIMDESNCGVLAEPGNANDFAKKIKRLLEDEALRMKLGENGRKAVLRYSWDKVAEKILG